MHSAKQMGRVWYASGPEIYPTIFEASAFIVYLESILLHEDAHPLSSHMTHPSRDFYPFIVDNIFYAPEVVHTLKHMLATDVPVHHLQSSSICRHRASSENFGERYTSGDPPLLLGLATTSSCRCTLGSRPNTAVCYRRGEPKTKHRACDQGRNARVNFP